MPPKRRLRDRKGPVELEESDSSEEASSPPKQLRTDSTDIINPPSQFLELPREIRDEIYHLIWLHKLPIIMAWKTSEFRIYYGISSISHGYHNLSLQEVLCGRRLIAKPWFLANKQVMHEAIEQYHRGSTWVFLNDFMPDTTSNPLDTQKLLLSPWKTHTLDLGPIRISEQAYLQSNERDMATRVEPLHPIIQPLRYRGAGFVTSPNLRILKFDLAMTSYGPSKDPNRHIDIDLRALSSLDLPSLNQVVIRVSFGIRFEGDEVVKARLKEEVRALASVLLGGSEGGDSLEKEYKQELDLIWQLTAYKNGTQSS